MISLYPLKFKPLYQEKIWGGGEMLKNVLNKECKDVKKCGEIWELSAIDGYSSVVINGFLKGNNITELVEIYMGDLVGESVYEKFGIEFPLLFKYIEAQDNLSIQVHPGDEIARKRHHAYGKTEMWYVVDADKGASIFAGFNQRVTRDMFTEYLDNGKLMNIVDKKEVLPGDVFFIPAGKIHAIGKGVLLAEIQQNSDITYRIFDFNREDQFGNSRELHHDLAIDVIDFNDTSSFKNEYSLKLNEPVEIVKCDYFVSNILLFNNDLERDYHRIDSFIVLMCIEGRYLIDYGHGREVVEKGETVLIPASLELIKMHPLTSEVKLIEVYVSG
jgi:mannose-6-phosphate isomerase